LTTRPTKSSALADRLRRSLSLKLSDHVGASLVPRSLDAFAFIGRQLNAPKWIDDTVLRFRASADENKKARGYPVKPFDPNRIHAE
jgi:hypothetical protein